MIFSWNKGKQATAGVQGSLVKEVCSPQLGEQGMSESMHYDNPPGQMWHS